MKYQECHEWIKNELRHLWSLIENRKEFSIRDWADALLLRMSVKRTWWVWSSKFDGGNRQEGERKRVGRETNSNPTTERRNRRKRYRRMRRLPRTKSRECLIWKGDWIDEMKWRLSEIKNPGRTQTQASDFDDTNWEGRVSKSLPIEVKNERC